MLTFVPTPIGNLEDISFRAINALKEAEIILCEDTRITKKLISLLNSKFDTQILIEDTKFMSLHSHNEESFLTISFQDVLRNKNVIYLSDAGMPCISDPGAKLVEYCLQNSIQYNVLPGANALLVAYAMSGFDTKDFYFYGFLPHKTQNRRNELEKILSYNHITILYESPHRVEKLFDELNEIVPKRKVFVTKELTKIYQKTYKGLGETLKLNLKNLDKKGEWVVIIDKENKIIANSQPITYTDIETLDISPKQKAKLLSKLSGQSIKVEYEKIIQPKDDSSK